MDIAESILPLKTGYTGVSCMNCMETTDNLLQCAGCHHIKYCGHSCQCTDWKIHKMECQFLKMIQETYGDIVASCTLLQKTVALTGMLERMINENAIAPTARENWGRTQRFVTNSRLCSICNKSDFEITDSKWINCPTCKFGWCCSQEHHDEYQSKRTQEIGNSYVDSIATSCFHWNYAKNYNTQFSFTPEFPTPTEDSFVLHFNLSPILNEKYKMLYTSFTCI